MPFVNIENGRVTGCSENSQSGWTNDLLEVDDIRLADFHAQRRANPPGAPLELRAKKECKRRIFAVVDEAAQNNMNAAMNADNRFKGQESYIPYYSEEEAIVYLSGLKWIGEMRAICARLISAGDRTFTDDKHWPDPGDKVRALAKRF